MRGHRSVIFNSSSLLRIVNVQPISPVFVLGMELPLCWTCWTRREYNCRPKMPTRKAIRTTRSRPFYCTNRLLGDGRNIFLRPRKAEHLEARGHRLPIPARSLVDKQGIIRAADVKADYIIRLEPAETLKELRNLTV